MRILVACEESQEVCKAFRTRGHEAYSCDIQPCSGGHPEWHLQVDALEMLKIKWDMVIAFPPCTHLAVSGVAWFEEKQADGRQQQGIDFFMQFANCDCPRVAIENPIGIMSNVWRKPDQIIHPWQFGESANKSTCLWLKNLPLLVPQVTEKPDTNYHTWTDKKTGRVKRQEEWYYQTRCLGKDRGKEASKTFPGVAEAMAEQWNHADSEPLQMELSDFWGE